MTISPGERTEERATGGSRERPDAANAASGDAANRLNADEWEFLRATPDFDAEEMASVGLPAVGIGAPLRWGTSPRAPARPVGVSGGSAAEFPEVGALAEMLDDLMDAPQETAAPAGAGAPAWINVPSEDEWAALMRPQGVTPPAAGEARDVLLDALAAGERIGLLPGPDAR